MAIIHSYDSTTRLRLIEKCTNFIALNNEKDSLLEWKKDGN
jgi:hypothetical protein